MFRGFPPTGGAIPAECAEFLHTPLSQRRSTGGGMAADGRTTARRRCPFRDGLSRPPCLRRPRSTRSGTGCSACFPWLPSARCSRHQHRARRPAVAAPRLRRVPARQHHNRHPAPADPDPTPPRIRRRAPHREVNDTVLARPTGSGLPVRPRARRRSRLVIDGLLRRRHARRLAGGLHRR